MVICAGAARPAESASAAGVLADASSVGGAAAVFFAAAFLAAFFAGFAAAAGIASTRRRATGASMVDEAERTNSPISCNLARTSLLSTPSSLASS